MSENLMVGSHKYASGGYRSGYDKIKWSDPKERQTYKLCCNKPDCNCARDNHLEESCTGRKDV